MSETPIKPRRSLIFVPGLRPDMVPKALATGADIVCIDIEDAIAPNDKDEARTKTLDLFAQAPATGGAEIMVRINSLNTPDGLKDVLALLASAAPPPAVMLPKSKSAAEVRLLDELLIERCAAMRFHVIIETNDALNAAYDIARACDRIDSILFGAVDMAAELRCEVAWEPLLYARGRLVNAAAGAGIDLIDVPYLDLNDADGLAREAAASAALGFTGKAAIHPKQIAPINAAFSPDDAALDYAHRVIDAFDQAEGGLVVVDGKLIEKPVLRSVHRTLAIAEKIGAA